MSRDDLDFHVFLWGSAGVGKTRFLIAFYQQVIAGILRVRLAEAASSRFLAQLTDSETKLERTAPVAAPLADWRAREAFVLIGKDKVQDPFQGRKVVVTALAFEDSSTTPDAGLPNDVDAIAELCRSGQRVVLVLLINPLLVDEDTAKLAFKSSIEDLMKLYATHPGGRQIKLATGTPSRLRAAVETSALNILGIPSQSTTEVRGLHELNDTLAGRLLDLPDDATLTSKRDESTGDRVFTICSHSADDDHRCADILDAINETASVAFRDYQRSLGVFNSLMHVAGVQFVVASTRVDCAVDLNINLQDAIQRSCQGRVKPYDVLQVSYAKVKPNADYLRVLENPRASYGTTTQLDRPMNVFVDAISGIVHHSLEKPLEPEKSSQPKKFVAAESSAEEQTAWGFTQHAGWTAAQFAPVLLLGAVIAWMVFGAAFWQWVAAGLFVMAALIGLVLTLHQTRKEWSYTRNPNSAKLLIGNKTLHREEISLWQSPLAKVFDVARLRTAHESHLITNAQRFMVISQISPSEPKARLMFEATLVIAIAISAAIVVRGVVL